MSENILDTIKQAKIDEVAERKRTVALARLEEQAAEMSAPRGFAAALRGDRPADAPRTPGRTPRLIAEIKKASPSAGIIRDPVEPSSIAAAYERGGAAALSCLTDEHFFHGSLDNLRWARSAVALPVLRKDFMIDPWQAWEARAVGADAILLIAGMIHWDVQEAIAAEARSLGMDVLLEIHEESELEGALELAPDVLGINNRNLRTADLATDLNTTRRLAAEIPATWTLISESGIRSREDVATLSEIGVDGLLVGEHLMREPDPGRAIGAVLGLGPYAG